MELLVTFLFEFLVTLALPAVILVVETVALIVELIVEVAFLLFDFFVDRRQKSTKEQGRPTPDNIAPDNIAPENIAPDNLTSKNLAPQSGAYRSRFRRWLRWSVGITAGLMAASLLAMMVIDLFFFESIVRRALKSVENASDIQVEFESASGSVWRGEVALENATFHREGHPKANFDLEIERFELDASLWDLLCQKRTFQSVTAHGLSGRYEREIPPPNLERSRSFTVGHMQVTDAKIEYVDHSLVEGEDVTVEFSVDRWTATEFRSGWALFDLMYRSEASGAIEDAPFTVTLDDEGEMHRSQWRLEKAPVGVLAKPLGPPLSWLAAGDFRLEVDSQWRRNLPEAEIEMKCRLELLDLQVGAPAELSLTQRLLVQPALAFFRKHAQKLHLEFTVLLPKHRFEQALSPEGAGIKSALADAIKHTLVEKIGDIAF